MSTTTTTHETWGKLKLIPRRSQDRGHADYGWLKTYHTFSFASYYDPSFEKFGPLRVINEDRVAPTQGFGKHQHREFEIWSYIVDGELDHRDSMGNIETLHRGNVQMTSAGTGIEHSEYNNHPSIGCHFLQIWALPNERGLTPTYYTRNFSDEEKLNKLCKTVAPVSAPGVSSDRDGPGPVAVRAALTMYSCILTPSSIITHTFSPSTTKAYVHLIMRSGYRSPSIPNGEKFENGGAKLQVNGGLVLEEGDGCFVEVAMGGLESKAVVESVGGVDAEWLLWEMEDEK